MPQLNGMAERRNRTLLDMLNGVAKRRNQTLFDMVRSMMSFTKLPPSFWGYSLETAAKLLNMAPSNMYRDTITCVLEVLEDFCLEERSALGKRFSCDSQRDEVLLEESSEAPQQNGATYFEPSVPLMLDNDPRAYGEAISVIDSDKWLEAIKFEMNSMGSNQVWTLVDPPKGVKPVGCIRSTNVSLEMTERLQPSRLGSWQKDTPNDPGSILRKPTR
ncbi:UNVERIFIED_CONTAM: hypothetical protein Sangu_2733300 [Sesamum angustifolium]|uniref:Integrase catalytic domain-containing protein n=1 Tax=Sesamum angustifolium TaxID=2727405 RepID=A0AAW2IW16_9LAMI